MFQDTHLQDRSRQLSDRERFLKKTIPFIEKLVQEKGVVTKRTEGSSHTRVMMELKDFGGFSFTCDWGQTMMGGNTVKAWHQSTGFVLRVYYQPANFTTEDCTVEVFEKDTTWQTALIKTIRDKRKILAAMAREKKSKHQALLRKAREKQKSVDLQKKASRLGL